MRIHDGTVDQVDQVDIVLNLNYSTYMDEVLTFPLSAFPAMDHGSWASYLIGNGVID